MTEIRMKQGPNKLIGIHYSHTGVFVSKLNKGKELHIPIPPEGLRFQYRLNSKRGDIIEEVFIPRVPAQSSVT